MSLAAVDSSDWDSDFGTENSVTISERASSSREPSQIAMSYRRSLDGFDYDLVEIWEDGYSTLTSRPGGKLSIRDIMRREGRCSRNNGSRSKSTTVP